MADLRNVNQLRGTSADMRRAVIIALLAAAACSDTGADGSGGEDAVASDPVIARALNDPLMTDPDLASRNEANAALGFIDSAALPVFEVTSQSASEAREAGRLELLEEGMIPDLPLPRPGVRGEALGNEASAAQLLQSLGAPANCAGALREDFALAAAMPKAAAIMPYGMVVQAAGSDEAPCRIRIVRYRTAAAAEDVLQYHYARALRQGMKAERYAEPEAILAAQGKGAALVVHARPTQRGMTAVDLLYRAM